MMMTADATRCSHSTEEVKGYQRLRSSHQMTFLSPRLICYDHYGLAFCPQSSRLFDHFLMDSHKKFTLWSMMELSKFDLRENYATFEAAKNNIRWSNQVTISSACVQFSFIRFLSPNASRRTVFICMNRRIAARVYHVSSSPKYFGKYANLQVKTIVVAIVSCRDYSLNVQCCCVLCVQIFCCCRFSPHPTTYKKANLST